ncbi:MAG: hypothetical protein JWP31_1078 [Aeromicrobium sp.]|nr:hypothetical protein [Aeromicrobium sp.]
MTDAADPIAYTALQPGTPVQSADGAPFGTVEAVLVVEEVSVFDGIVVSTEGGRRFVDADHVGAITTAYVLTTLTAAEAVDLPVPDDAPVFRADARDDTGSSISDRLGRIFGRGTWDREQ